MLNKFYLLSFFILLSIGYNASAQDDKVTFGGRSIKQVIASMTVEEKSLFVTGAKRRNVFPQPLPGFRLKDITGVGGYTYPFVNLGIPSIMLSDGPAGLRIAPRRPKDEQTYYCTAFPVATLMASTWNTELIKELGAAIGKEALEYGVDIMLAPGMNIQRDLLGGRNFEYFSEDPLVTGKMAAAIVNGIQSRGIGASIKHFAVNNQETNRRIIDAVLSERALREIYLQGFKIAIKESDPWTVMSSYNKINGVYTSESAELLETILRKEWGFKGFVLTDWYGGMDPVAQVKAGNDLLMPGLELWTQKIDSALRFNTLSPKVIDQNIERILKVVGKTTTFKNLNFSNKPDLAAHAVLAQKVAEEGIILLKNEKSALPFVKGTSIAAFGNYSYKLIPGGTGSGMVNNLYSVSTVEGLEKAGFKVDTTVKSLYKYYLKDAELEDIKADSLITAMRKPDKILPEMVLDESLIVQKSLTSDAAVITIMRVFGEGGDRNLKTSYYLTAAERKLIESVSAAFRAKGKKVIVVLNVGGIIEMESWQSLVDAVLLPWQPGQEGGSAIASVISGKANPSGRLAVTIPTDYKTVPTAENFPGSPKNKPLEVVHEEGIFVGYRYFDTFKVRTLYDFGHGLSYSNFDYADLKLSTKNFTDQLEVSVVVKNTSKVAGKEVVQMYIKAPTQTLVKPEKELKGFAKTKLLQPGESQTLVFKIDRASLASFNTEQNAWIADKGNYIVKIGSAANQIKQSGSFDVKKNYIVEKVNKVLVPKSVINEISPEKSK
ncbi:MAG: beta-glucosidase [Pedobacter sp.]|nr:MAG: beta-glucosidase [Pedobacter sp.]